METMKNEKHAANIQYENDTAPSIQASLQQSK